MSKRYGLLGLIALVLAAGVAHLHPRQPNAAEITRWLETHGTLPRSDTRPEPRDQKLNFLVILADDLGYTDLSAYGSEIPTPNLDALAAGGSRLTNFYTSPTCAPTRAMLLTGQPPHAVQVGSVFAPLTPPWATPNRSYLGHLPDDVVTLPEALRDAGYATFIAGKWHLGGGPEHGPEQHGFDRSFVLIEGGASHFGDAHGIRASDKRATYREDGKAVSPAPGFYSTDAYTDKLLGYLRSVEGTGQPFFAYLSYTAPHWPLQAPEDWIDRFRHRYDAGFAPILAARLEKGRDQGVVRPSSVHSQKLRDLVERWSDLSRDARANLARRMEVYAAMVAKMDHRIGDVLAYLEEVGQRENTVVLFFSDNGPDFFHPEALLLNRRWVSNTFDNRLENIGRPGSYVSYGPDWAKVSAGPLRLFKATAMEGGIKVPAILSWPGSLAPGSNVDSLISVMDVYPTFLSLAGVPSNQNTYRQAMVLTEETPQRSPAGTPLIWEATGSRAVRDGDWKLVLEPQPFGTGRWQLFNLLEDPYETNDRIETAREESALLKSLWSEYAEVFAVQSPPAWLQRMIVNAEPTELRH